MTKLRIDREHIDFNQGGHVFTLYWRWRARTWIPSFFRIYLLGWSFCTLKAAQ